MADKYTIRSAIQTPGWNIYIPYLALDMELLLCNLGKGECIPLLPCNAQQPRCGYSELHRCDQRHNSEQPHWGHQGQGWRLGSGPKGRSSFHPSPQAGPPMGPRIPCFPPPHSPIPPPSSASQHLPQTWSLDLQTQGPSLARLPLLLGLRESVR